MMKEKAKAAVREGIVLEIQRMSTEDGPGLRTTIFLKGCPLRCDWCHNPESISPKPQIHWLGNRCIDCGICFDLCPRHALSKREDGVFFDRDRCTGCGACAEECPSTALELMGKRWDVDALIREVIKDRAYFEKSEKGGITLSGGEVTMQPHFAAALLNGLKGLGVHTAIDTCGMCARDRLAEILPYADMVLFDLKVMDPERHREVTGSSNELILENAKYVAEFMKGHVLPKEMWVRTPVIPGATDTVENIRAIGGFIAAHLGEATGRWELCAFNNLCRDKYTRLGIDWRYRDTALMSREDLERLASAARESGVKPGIVNWSGSTRIIEAEKNDAGGRDTLRLVKKSNPCST